MNSQSTDASTNVPLRCTDESLGDRGLFGMTSTLELGEQIISSRPDDELEPFNEEYLRAASPDDEDDDTVEDDDAADDDDDEDDDDEDDEDDDDEDDDDAD